MADVASQTSEFDSMSVKEFNGKLQADPEFNARYLKDPQAPEFTKINEQVAALMQKHGNKWSDHLNDDVPAADSGASQGQGSSQGSTETAVDVGSFATDDEIVVNVKVPKLLFGSYLTGRTPDQAILEALKGNQQKDLTISVLKNQSLATHDENLSLRSRVKIAMEQAAKPQVAAIPQEVLDAAALDIDNIDHLDPEEVEKANKSRKAMASFVKGIQQPAQQSAEAAQQAKAEIAKLSEEDEYARIRQLQIEDPSLMTTVDFKSLDQSVRAFIDGMSRVSGGLSTKDAWTRYNDPQLGEQFRAQCAAAGVVKPAELDQHSKVIEARNKILPVINEERAKAAAELTSVLRKKGKLGESEAVTVDEVEVPSYASIWKRIAAASGGAPVPVQPAAAAVPVINPALQQQIEARQAQTATVPLIPPGASAPVFDPSQMAADTFLQLDDKFRKNPNSITRDEAQILKQGYEFSKFAIPKELRAKL